MTERESNKSTAKLDVLERSLRIGALLTSLIVGTSCGLILLFSTYILLWQGGAHMGEHLSLLSIFLPGYNLSPAGAWIGFLWGFVVGWLATFIAYNAYSRMTRRRLVNYLIRLDENSLPFINRTTLLLSGRAFGAVFGVLFATALIVSTNWLVLRGAMHDSQHASLLANYLPGYSVSFSGSLMGALTLFLLVFAACQLFCSIYNRTARGDGSLIVAGRETRPATPEKSNVLNEAQLKAKKVVILGAGPAGLATGHELVASGVSVIVVERNAYVGGLCRTVHDNGYSFDLGGHRWFTKNEALNRWFRRLMADEVVMVERISRIYYGGKYFQYPVEIMDVVKNAGVLTIIKAGFAILWSTTYYAVFNPKILNMKQAYTAQFGATLYEMFFRRYTEKVWGKPCEELSSDWVSQRSKGLSIWTVLQEALSNKKSDIKSLIDEFMYPRDGYVRIPERMAEDIETAGNNVLLNAEVQRIEYHGPNNIDVLVKTDQGMQTLNATDVVSTIPLGVLARITTPNADTATLQAAKELQFRDLITVNLKLCKNQVSKDTWLYVQDEDILFGRLHEPKNWSVAMVPDLDHTSLVLECFCTKGDEIWQMSDDDVAQRCVDDLIKKLKFIQADEVEGWTVIRTLHTYPVYDMGYAPKIARIKEYLAGFDGIHIVGRGGTFRYNNADHSIEMGLLLGQKIRGFNVDPLGVNTEPEYQEVIDQEMTRDQYRAPNQATIA